MANEEFVRYEEVMEVPREVGLEGFIRALREILKLPRVQHIHIDVRGKIEYAFFMQRGEEKRVVTMNFSTLMPMALVRNAEVAEVPGQHRTPGNAVSSMFNAAQVAHLIPIGFVVGANSHLWDWLTHHSMQAPSQSSFFGLPVHTDRSCPDEALILCTAFRRDAELVEMKKAFKITIPPGAA